MADKPVVACIPDGSPGYVPGSDYQLVLCPQCQRRCWIGPNSRRLVDAAMAELLCGICVARRFGATGAQYVFALDPNAKSRCDPRAFRDGFGAMTDEQIERLGRD